MARAWQLVIKASANDREAKRALRSIGRDANDLQQKVGRAMGAIAKTSALALGAGLAATVAVGVKELGEMQKATAQTDAVIKSTGGTANVTRREVEALAGAIARKAGIDDQAVQSGQNMLLTFTNVRNEAGKGNDIFNQSTQILADMSVAMGTDMSKQAIQLGKALNDPIKGVTALSKVGVSFTADQKAQIKSLVDSGKTMQAQKIILAELRKEFGGSAAAYGTTLPGMVGRIKEAFAGTAATIVSAFLPAITSGASKLSELVARVQAWATSDKGQASLASLRQNLQMVGNAIGSVIGFIARHRSGLIVLASAVLAGVAAYKAFMVVKAVSTAVQTAIILFKAWRLGTLAQTAAQMGLNAALIANPIGLVVVGLAALVAGLVVAYKRFEGFRNVVNGVFNWIRSNWPKLLVILTGPIGLAAVAIIKNWDKIKAGATSLYKGVVGRLNDLVGWIRKMPGKISAAAGGMFSGLKDAFRDALNYIIGKWNSFDLTLSLPSKLGGGSISIGTPNMPYMARGGRVTQPAIIGEDGDEQIVPLSSKYRKDGIRNLLEAADALGVPMFAKGKGTAKAKPKPAAAKPKPKPKPKSPTAPAQNDVALATADGVLAAAEETSTRGDDATAMGSLVDFWKSRRTQLQNFLNKNRKKLKKDQIADTLGKINEATRNITSLNGQISGLRQQDKDEAQAAEDLAAQTAADNAARAEQEAADAASAADAAENLRREALGIDETVEQERHRKKLNEIRAQYGLPPLPGPGESSTTDGGGTSGPTDASGGALTGIDIKALFGGSEGAGRAFVSATQAAAGQTVQIHQTFTGEPNMAAAAQSAAWSFTTVMASAPGAAA